MYKKMFLMISLGVMILQSCITQYGIKKEKLVGSMNRFTPMRKNGLFWKKHDTSFYHEDGALNVINTWKENEEVEKRFNNSTFIIVK